MQRKTIETLYGVVGCLGRLSRDCPEMGIAKLREILASISEAVEYVVKTETGTAIVPEEALKWFDQEVEKLHDE